MSHHIYINSSISYTSCWLSLEGICKNLTDIHYHIIIQVRSLYMLVESVPDIPMLHQLDYRFRFSVADEKVNQRSRRKTKVNFS